MNRGVNHVPGFACKPSTRDVHEGVYRHFVAIRPGLDSLWIATDLGTRCVPERLPRNPLNPDGN
jgi:hypothetical protein